MCRYLGGISNMNKNYKRNLSKFIRNYLLTVVSLGMTLAIVVVTAYSTDTQSKNSFNPSSNEIIIYKSNDDVITDVSKDSTETESSDIVFKPNIDEVTYYVELSTSEIYMLATLIYLEGNTESIECQRAICSVVVNRMIMWDMSLEEVIYQKNQFTPAHLIEYYNPTDVQIEIVKEIMKDGVTIPEYVCYFRADHYHNWSGMNDYINLDHTYFSFSNMDYQQYIKECNNEI